MSSFKQALNEDICLAKQYYYQKHMKGVEIKAEL